jgi:plastocyanin
VKLKGTPPPELTINEAEPICGKFMTKKPLKTRHYVVGADQGLANVFVYIKSGAPKTPPSGEGPVLDQTSCEYVPYVMGVQAGQKFKIKNSDPAMHNVHATPKVNAEFNFAQPLKDQVNEKAFEKPEVTVRMKCDVHPWMFAYIGVTEHPYFAVTDKDGNFKIAPPDSKSRRGVSGRIRKGRGVSKEIDVKETRRNLR